MCVLAPKLAAIWRQNSFTDPIGHLNLCTYMPTSWHVAPPIACRTFVLACWLGGLNVDAVYVM